MPYARVLDTEAMSWAWRIASRRDITFKELKTYSEGWLRGPEVTAELLEKVQTRLQSGETPALSISEMGRMEAGKKKIHELTARS